MRKLFASGVLLLALMLAATVPTLAAGIYGDYFFGKAQYSDSDSNGFDCTLNGFRVGGELEIYDNIWLAGSFFSGSEADALELQGGNGTADLDNSAFDLGAAYEITDGIKVGLGWISFDMEVAGEGYSETRKYSGFKLAGALDMPLQKGLALQASANFAPALKVADVAKGDVGDPDRTAETEYGGNLMNYELGLAYEVYDSISVTAGYRGLNLAGEGDPDHSDYRFLKHEYQTAGFFLGVKAAF